MKQARKLLADAAACLELPPDIVAGLPSVELTGFRQLSVEPHQGLLEYQRERLRIETSLGSVCVYGSEFRIKLMNRERITIEGQVSSVELERAGHE